jgi:tripartite-type tricarboxylate transporter receptor subunit TctC
MTDPRTFSRRLTLAAAAGLTLLAAVPAVAQSSWPAKPVRMVVPFASGGSTDVVARMLAQQLSLLWGQTIVVENRAGAGGKLGVDLVAKAAPDGSLFQIRYELKAV